jgi:hypothetical protein
MRVKKLINKFFLSIPYLSAFFESRRHDRYEPREELHIEIKSEDSTIYGQLIDISLGGMKIISTDNRIEASNIISLALDDFQLDLPCKTIQKVGHYYRIEFDQMTEQVADNLRHFIDFFTKQPSVPGPTEILR